MTTPGNKIMTTDEAIAWAGSIRALAAKLEIWPHSVYKWGEKPPRLRQFQIERLSKGKVKADE